MGYSREERLGLCALLDEVGPEAPTLCAGWTSRDLAAHLVLREHRPDAGAGIMVGPLAGYTARVQEKLSTRTPYPDLVNAIRTGPPKFSLWGIPGLDERANVVEYFVHHEDVRRAAPDWKPRETSRGLSNVLWDRLRMAKFVLRKLPVGLEFARDDDGAGGDAADGSGFRMTIRRGTPVVTVIGTPAELTMWAMGRTSSAHVRLDGTDAAVRTLSQAHWRL
jgi:uncharacterized protein (TIGR03085 family)